MVIEFGEAEVLERHVAKALGGLVGRDVSVADGFEQLAQASGVHVFVPKGR